MLRIASFLWDWSMEARWRTWMFHSLFAAIIAFAFGPLAAIVFFGIREGEQLLLHYIDYGTAGDVEDRILDYAVPFFTAVLGSAIGIW